MVTYFTVKLRIYIFVISIMSRFTLFILIALAIVNSPLNLGAQMRNDSLPKVINLDSLSADDEALLVQYKDSFKNDLYDFLDIISPTKQVKVDTSVYDMDRSSHVEVSLDFVSRQLINGRIIALSTSKGKVIALTGVGFYPTIMYYHKYGFYAELNTTFYTDYKIAHAAPVPVVTPSAGYEHTFFKRWFIGAGYEHTFNTYGSSLSRQLLNNTMTITSSVDVWKKFIFSSVFYVFWSSDHSASLPPDEKLSVELLLSLKKEFVIYNFLGAKEFTITPAMNFNFANDNRTFVSALAVSDVKGDSKKDTIVRTQNVNDFFGFLDLEPSINFDWRIRNVDIFLLPTLAVPLNIFYPGKDERVLDPKVFRFYVQAGVKYLFCVKPKHLAINQPIKDSLLN